MRHQFSQRFPRRPTAWWRHLLSDFAPANPPHEVGERQGKLTKLGPLMSFVT